MLCPSSDSPFPFSAKSSGELFAGTELWTMRAFEALAVAMVWTWKGTFFLAISSSQEQVESPLSCAWT
jgi:hypothetical protein